MREFNLLENYPKPKNPRLVNSKLRTIENRILASFGLKYMHTDSAPGFHALLEQSNIPTNTTIGSEDVAFKIAPRINACGRLIQNQDFRISCKNPRKCE